MISIVRSPGLLVPDVKSEPPGQGSFVVLSGTNPVSQSGKWVGIGLSEAPYVVLKGFALDLEDRGNH